MTYLPVLEATGLVDLEELEASLREDTLLVSVMAVNNEIGTRQPVEEIGQMCRKRKILFHTDGEWGGGGLWAPMESPLFLGDISIRYNFGVGDLGWSTGNFLLVVRGQRSDAVLARRC